MNLFVNDVPIKIYKPKETPPVGSYDYIVKTPISGYIDKKLIQRVWIQDAFKKDIEIVLDFIASGRFTKNCSFHITTRNYKKIKKYIKNQFKIIDAAGGIVSKTHEVLLINRLKKWDLPKGKKEPNEKYRETARREIEEECNVKAIPKDKLCTTWHTYTEGRKNILKKTKWYAMHLVDDTNMRPCLDEHIEQTKWMTRKKAARVLSESYQSIQLVFSQYCQTHPDHEL